MPSPRHTSLADTRSFRRDAVAVLAGAGLAAVALATDGPVAPARADTGTFDFELPTITSAMDTNPLSGTYELPDYNADGSWTAVTVDSQSINYLPGFDESRFFDLTTGASWDQLNIGNFELLGFGSPLVVDGIPQGDSAVINEVLFTLGNTTLFGYEYDSAHSVIDVLGYGGTDLFSIPATLDYGAHISDALAGSAGAVDAADLTSLLGWL